MQIHYFTPEEDKIRVVEEIAVETISTTVTTKTMATTKITATAKIIITRPTIIIEVVAEPIMVTTITTIIIATHKEIIIILSDKYKPRRKTNKYSEDTKHRKQTVHTINLNFNLFVSLKNEQSKKLYTLLVDTGADISLIKENSDSFHDIDHHTIIILKYQVLVKEQ